MGGAVRYWVGAAVVGVSGSISWLVGDPVAKTWRSSTQDGGEGTGKRGMEELEERTGAGVRDGKGGEVRCR